MGPPENPTRQTEKQEAHGANGRLRRPRPRQCLLKGCERRFRPQHARQRYCSPQCREAARAWSGWKARRFTGPRRRAREAEAAKPALPEARQRAENHLQRKAFRRPRGSSLRSFFDDCCDRPGCYECFVRSRRSPLQRFCSQACQRAMERVWERERRWQRRHGRPRRRAGRRPCARQP